MLGIIWFFGACQQPTDSSDASGNETTNAPPVAHVSLSQTVPVGDSVQVDGRNSSDPDGDQLTYQWTLAAVPSRSSARLTNTDTPVTTFQADMLGEYVVELTVSDGEADSSRTGIITAVADQAPQLGDITTDVVWVYGNRVDSTQTWPAVNAPYRFRESVMVNGTDTDSISLRIQPGASFQFAEDTQLTIGEYAALVAEGTISRPITFTGAKQTPGYRGGIEFFGSAYAINSLHHVNIAYGGGLDIDERSGTAANLLLNDFYDPVQLTISNSLVGYSANYGIYVGGDREGLTVNCQGLAYLENAGGPTGGEGTLHCDGGGIARARTQSIRNGKRSLGRGSPARCLL